MSSQALASLTATYTDSEGEEDINNDDEEEDNFTSNTQEDSGDKLTTSPSISKIPSTANSNSGSPNISRFRKLVSYHDDTVVSDDDDLQKTTLFINERGGGDDSNQLSSEPGDLESSLLGDELPPAPKKKCPQDLQDKITRLYDKMVNSGLDMNYVIQQRKDFRNPSIYEKLIQFCGIKELGTNYPAEIYDPLKWGKESYFEELAKVQKSDMEAREKERKEKTKIEFVSGTKKQQAEDEAKKRKSKWDQPASNASINQTTLKPAGLVQPTLTTAVTGTKGTVISAFGSLPKKPRLDLD